MSKRKRAGREKDLEVAKEDPRPPVRRDGRLLAGILLVAAVIYFSSLGNGFIYYDDPDVVVNNPWIRHLGLANLVHFFTTPVQFMFMPLALVSYAIDHQLGGISPFVYHLHNLVLHLGCVALVYWVFLLLTRKPRVALLVSLLFAVHPVNVDTVASVAARTNLLVTLFSLLALACYGLYVERGHQLRYLALSCLAFLLAACAKSSAVVLPLTLLLWDYFLGRRWEKRLWMEKLPFLAIAAFFGVLTLRMRVDVPPPVHYHLLDRALVFLYALASYCVRLVFPLNLSMAYDYPVEVGGWLPWPYYLAPLLLALIGWGLYKLGISRKVLIVGLAFFVVNVALSQSVLLIDNFMANRYVYLAYLGLFLILAEASEQLWSAAPGGWRAGLRSRTWTGALVVFVLGFAALAFARNAVWRDSLTLFDDVLQKQPGSAWVWGTRGLFKLHTNDLPGAREDLDQSLKLDPNYTPGLSYRGEANYLAHDYQAALTDLNRAISNAPNLAGAYRDRGKVKLELKDERGALEDLDRAIAIDPRSEARSLRGALKSSKGDYRGALADLDAAVAVVPDAGTYRDRGRVKLALQDEQGALDDFDRAVSLDPRSEARFWRGMVKIDRGDYRGALTDLDAVIAGAPDDAEALFLRGLAKVNLSDRAAGCADLGKAQSLGYKPAPGQRVPDCR
jgi:tetratricopeptide (TPR) repeat protein